MTAPNHSVPQDDAGGWPGDPGAPPFLRLDMRDGAPRTRGSTACRLGRPIPNPATGQDEGVFASWDWDGATLTARVDPLGFHSLFYWQDGPTLILSPSILQLIAQGAGTAPDRRALGVFYRLGLFLNEDTPFRDIRALPPGGVLCWQAGRMTLTRHDMQAGEHPVTRDAAIDGIIDMTRDSLRNILSAGPGDAVLPLSGGRDSRHILLALDHLGARPSACVTFQQTAGGLHSETRAARAICERVGIEHRVLAGRRPVARDILRSIVLTSLCSDEHSQMIPMHDYLRLNGLAAYDGIAGDILTNPDDAADTHYRRFQAGDFEGIARGMMDGHAAVISQPGFTGGPGALFAPETEDEALAYVTATIEGYKDAPDPYQSFWFWHRTRREIGFVPGALFGSGAGALCPYLDTRFVRFCLSLPYAVTRDQQLHNLAIARGYPRAADVEFGDSFAPPPPARGSVLAKVQKALTGVSTVLALRPKHPLTEIRHYLRGSPALHRKPGEVFQLYNLVLDGIDADFAASVLRLARDMGARAPRDLVSDRYLPVREG